MTLKDPNANKTEYKHTKIGWIPKEWEIAPVAHMVEIILSNVDKHIHSDEQVVKLCNYTDVYYNNHITNSISFASATATLREIQKFSIKLHDVIITKDSESSEDIAVPAIVTKSLDNVLCGYHLAILRPNELKIKSNFLYYILQNQHVRYGFSKRANGVTRFGLGLDSISKTNLILPPIPEQEKIAAILSTWDEAIDQTKELLSSKKSQMKALMQQLLTGIKRLHNFKNTWKETQLSNYIKAVSFPVKKPDASYIAIGIRSHGKGTFKRKINDPDKVAMDTLFRIKPGVLIVNITFAWEGAIAITKDEDKIGLVSHRFPTFEFLESASPSYFKFLILSQRFVWDLKLISPGGAGRNRVLSKKDFLKIILSMPTTYNEQQAIATVLQTAEDEILDLEKQKSAYEKQKKGLMQKLLTGNIRIKTKEKWNDKYTQLPGKSTEPTASFAATH